MFRAGDKVIIKGLNQNISSDILNGDHARVMSHREGSRLCKIQVDKNGRIFYIMTDFLDFDEGEHAEFDPEIDDIIRLFNEDSNV